MKWLVILGVFLGAYYYFLIQTTNAVMGQLQTIQNQYTYVAQNADRIATGQ